MLNLSLHFGQDRFFSTPEIEDYRLRTAAELIDQIEGKRGDRIVTERDLEQTRADLATHDNLAARHKLDKSPLRALMPQEVDVLRSGLPALAEFLHKKQPEMPRPFATSIRADAITDDQVRDTASALIECFKPGDEELNLRQLLKAKRALAALDAQQTPLDPELAQKLDQAIRAGKLSPEAFQKLDLFMLSGKGGLASWGPVRINGREFTDVYRLPADPEIVKLEPNEKIGVNDGKTWNDFERVAAPDDDAADDKSAKGAKPQGGEKKAARSAADDGDDSGPNALDRLIDRYEKRFTDTGYDRIYIRGFDGHLYVALNEKGSLDGVRALYHVQMRHERQLADSGEVLRVVDINNSLSESTFGFWRAVVKKATSSLRSLFYEKLDSDIASAAKSVVEASADDKSSKPDLGSMLVAGTLVASVGAAIFSLPAALTIVGTTTATVTAANVVDYLTTKRDKAAFYHAAGVTVNRSDALEY